MTEDDHHLELMRELRFYPVTVEDIARAWASIDGNRDAFDEEKELFCYAAAGHYPGYMAEAEALVERAVAYAKERMK